MADTAELDEIAVTLYALPPGEFTAARNARAAGADPTLAKAVKALRKPVVSAWAIDLLVHADVLGDALALAAELREAQDDLDAAELARLNRQRRALVSGLAQHAARLAGEHGVTVSAAARDDIEKTLNAAMRDAAAAAAVMTGRLVQPLQASGLDAIDPDTLLAAVAGTPPAGMAPPPARSRDDLAERRARKAAERAAADADRARSEAERVLARAEAAADQAQERVALREERIEALRGELERAETDAAAARAALDERTAERTEALTRARAARASADSARVAADAVAADADGRG